MQKIGIIGAGIMGTQLACLFGSKGFEVVLKTRTESDVEKAMHKVEERLIKYYPNEKDAAIHNIVFTSDFKRLRDTDIVIDCITEDKYKKQELFIELDKICSRKTIFASNTSSISINQMILPAERLKQTLTVHFFNPVEKMRLVEINAGMLTIPGVMVTVVDLVTSLEKTPMVMKNIPGGVVNRLLFASINEAGYMLEENGLLIEHIDVAMKLGLNHPMGLLELADFIGLDTVYNILKTFHVTVAGFKPPAQVFEQMVRQGRLGRKSGSGFYDYQRR